MSAGRILDTRLIVRANVTLIQDSNTRYILENIVAQIFLLTSGEQVELMVLMSSEVVGPRSSQCGAGVARKIPDRCP